MIVVADAGPLRYLVLIEHSHVLPVLYGRVLVPPAVITELSEAERRGLPVLGTLRVLADAAEYGLADLPTAFDRLKQTNFRASEQLFRSLLAREAARRQTP